MSPQRLAGSLIPLPWRHLQATFHPGDQTRPRPVGPSGDMEGTLAVVAGMYHSGRVVISSTHPEFSGDAGILEEMCFWAAG